MIQSKPDILAVMQREGIELKRRGRDYWAACFLHEDKHPSMKVSPERQRWHCFGCGGDGDAIDFIQKRRGIDFKDTLSILGIRKGRPMQPDPVKERQRQLLKAFEAWRRSYYYELCDKSIELNSLRIKAKERQASLSEGLAFAVAEALAELPLIDYRLNILQGRDDEAKYLLFREITSNDRL